MRLYQLVPTNGKNLVVYNGKTGHMQVLTPDGAVYDTEDTGHVANMSIAFGLLVTSEDWREATQEEINHLRRYPPQRLVEIRWTVPPPPQRLKPKLRIVKDHNE